VRVILLVLARLSLHSGRAQRGPECAGHPGQQTPTLAALDSERKVAMTIVGEKNMKRFLLAALITATPALAQSPASAPGAPARGAVPDVPHNWATIVMTANVNHSADDAWKRIKGDDYCAFITYLGMNSCVLTVGTGDVGTNRRLNGTIDELMVSKTSHSYVYAQPTSAIFYHGTMAVEQVDASHSRIVYTLLYDNANIAPADRPAEMDRRRGRFQAAIDKMAAAANGP